MRLTKREKGADSRNMVKHNERSDQLFLERMMASIRLSLYPVGILTVTHQVVAYDAASVYFSQAIRRTDILV